VNPSKSHSYGFIWFPPNNTKSGLHGFFKTYLSRYYLFMQGRMTPDSMHAGIFHGHGPPLVVSLSSVAQSLTRLSLSLCHSHSDTNQCQAELEELNALAAVIDQANGQPNAAVGTLEEQAGSAQRAYWNAFKAPRVRSDLGHVGESALSCWCCERWIGNLPYLTRITFLVR
jgi:hypothetical protein